MTRSLGPALGLLLTLAGAAHAQPAADPGDAGAGDASSVAPEPAAPSAGPGDGGASRSVASPARLPAADAVVVMNFGANAGAAEQAAGLADALAHRLSQAKLTVLTQGDLVAALGLERQKELTGCGETGCLAEIGAALGARFVVSGRVDRLGESLVVLASVWDGLKSGVSGRARREGSRDAELPRLIDSIADELLPPLGVAPAVAAAPARADRVGIDLSLKLGTQLLTSIFRLAPQADLELAWRPSPEWALFLQVSAGIALAETSTVTATPGLLGARRFFRTEDDLQPFLGGGVGVMATVNALRNAARPGLIVLGGLQYRLTRRVGLSVEASADLLAAAYEFASTQLSGVNFGLSLGVVFSL